MKLVTFSHRGAVGPGVLSGETVHPLPDLASMNDLVALGLDGALALGRRAESGPGVPLSDVTLLAPLEPSTLRDFVAFEEHVAGVRRSIEGSPGVPEAWYDAPAFYFSNPCAVVGPDVDVAVPARSVDLDFELEVAAVIGTVGADHTPASGHDAIFGYTILNDWSARDLQRPEMQVGLGPAKGKDFASSLGPCLVTADELEDSHDADGFLALWCEARVNDQLIGQDLLSNMSWTFGSMVAHASRNVVLRPGDVLGSGTMGNGGCLAELWGRNGRQDPPPLRAGDVVSLTVEGIGTLRNRVVTGSDPAPAPAARIRDAAAARQAHLDQRADPVAANGPQ
jgi:2-keto-4-pentenoate hydratase/2-oxohepta-3-ene-1,7-dioic acid hydratase in catechol pathway